MIDQASDGQGDTQVQATHPAEVPMSGTKKNSQAEAALSGARRMAAQLPPLAKSTSEAAKRSMHKTRAWAAPQLERGGQALQHQVAPKVSAALSTAAQRIDPPVQPKPRQWRKAVAISLLALAGAVTALARWRRQPSDSAPADDAAADDETPAPEETHESASH
jgi:ElaB/YqjD/DUF883 family membrane-anchored ribosome-binding protein